MDSRQCFIAFNAVFYIQYCISRILSNSTADFFLYTHIFNLKADNNLLKAVFCLKYFFKTSFDGRFSHEYITSLTSCLVPHAYNLPILQLHSILTNVMFAYLHCAESFLYNPQSICCFYNASIKVLKILGAYIIFDELSWNEKDKQVYYVVSLICCYDPFVRQRSRRVFILLQVVVTFLRYSWISGKNCLCPKYCKRIIFIVFNIQRKLIFNKLA